MTPRRPTVDVIMPLHNKGPYVERAVRSVLDQSYPMTRLVVADDGSTDDGVKRVEAMAAQDPRIMLVRTLRPSGPSAARNLAITRCSATYVAMLDADDYWEPTKLEEQMRRFYADKEVGLVHCGYRLIDEQGHPLPDRLPVRPPAEKGEVYDSVRLGTYAVTGSASAVVVRRDLLLQAGLFSEDLRYGEDWDLWVRIAALAHFDHVDEPLVHIRVLSSTHSRSLPPEEVVLFAVRLMDQWADDPAFVRKALPVLRRRIGSEQRRMLRRPLFLLADFPKLLRASGTRLGPLLYPGLFYYWAITVYRLFATSLAAAVRHVHRQPDEAS